MSEPPQPNQDVQAFYRLTDRLMELADEMSAADLQAVLSQTYDAAQHSAQHAAETRRRFREALERALLTGETL